MNNRYYTKLVTVPKSQGYTNKLTNYIIKTIEYIFCKDILNGTNQ